MVGVTPTTFHRRVADRVRKARWRLGLTQEDAAVRTGLSARYFAEVERGLRNPSIGTLFSIAHALKVRVADLVDAEPGARIDLDAPEVKAPPLGRKPRAKAARR